MTSQRHPIASLLAPASVAIIGASNDPSRIGGRPIAYLQQAGYAGAIFPVNPGRQHVQDLVCYPRIGAVPAPVDCALIVLPAENVLETVRECAAAGVRSAMIFSSGFAETGEHGAENQRALSRIAAETGMRILGPNIVGAFNTASRAFLTFSGAVAPAIGAPSSPIALVSQSGGYAGYLLALAQERALAFGKWITTGNEADVDVAEVIDYLADDPDTRIILAYVEGVARGEAFMRAVAKARAAGKQVIVLKVGRTESGARAAASHTASLAGSDAVFAAACRQFGALRARSATEMLDIAKAALKGAFPAGNRLGVITVSGGVGVEIADLAEEHGLALPSLDERSQDSLLAIVPFAATRNPVDITAQFTNDPTIINRSLEVLFDSDLYDAVVLFLGHAAAFPVLGAKFADAVAQVRDKYPDRLLAICALGTPDVLARYEELGCLVFPTPGPAVATLAALHRLAPSSTAERLAQPCAAPHQGAVRALSEFEGKRFLRGLGVTVPDDVLAPTPRDARRAAEKLGGPAVLKIASPDIAHKSEVGGVALGLADPVELERIAQQMLDTVAERAPEARIEGLIVAPMITGGTECIVGLRRDPSFGPVAIFGIGGIAVELLRDVSFRVGAIDEAEALAMIRETRCWPLLDGFRGSPACDIDALARLLADLSTAFCRDGRIHSIEINPLLVRPAGQGVVPLDCLVELTDSSD